MVLVAQMGEGPTRRGKIIIDISDTMLLAGSTKIIKTQDFYVNSLKIDIEGTIKNLGKNDQGHWVIISSARQTMTKTNGDNIIENYTDTIEWINGFETPEKSDNVYYKSGSGSISMNDTVVFSRVITKPLLRDSCEFISSGIVEITRNNNKVTINYGNGTCDNIATVTTDSTTEDINLFSPRFKEGGRFDKRCHRSGGW